MSKCLVEYKEIRFVIDGELTHSYVLSDAIGDCPIGVQGWHHKAFPANVTVIDVMNAWLDGHEDPVKWPQKSPE